MNQIVFAHVGQAGIQIGGALWQLFCEEHHLDYEGKPKSQERGKLACAYHQTKTGKYHPRAIFIDRDPEQIQELTSPRTSCQQLPSNSYSTLIQQCKTVKGQESCFSLYTQGYYFNEQLLSETIYSIRRELEKTDRPQGIVFTHSICGGTGSGFMHKIFQEAQSLCPKLLKMCVTVFPSPNYSSLPVEPYNAVFAIEDLIQFCDLVIPVTNQKLYKIYEDKIKVENPSFLDINQMIAEICSNLTVDSRFPEESVTHQDLNTLATNLVFYPKSHFITASYSPFPTTSGSSITSYKNNISQLTKQVFRAQNDFVSNSNFYSGYTVASNLIYRGSNVNQIEALGAASQIQYLQKQFKFSQACLKAIKANINNKKSYFFTKNGNTESTSVTNFCNTSSITEIFSKISLSYDTLLRLRSFIFWYEQGGREVDKFCTAREALSELQRDYNTMHREQAVDEQQ